jgi:hypothetical protein
MAPTIYITGNPTRTAAVTRDFGRALGRLTAVSPYTGMTDKLSVALADPIGMKALHMITADPQRTPTLVMFADPDYFFFAGAPNCSSPCVFIPAPGNFTFAWNHGSIEPEIATTWLGMVGPGIENLGTDSTTWMDHADFRPTMLTLLGLEDDYVHDGRVLAEVLTDWAQPSALSGSFIPLSETYKQLNAPFGQFAMDALVASTRAIKSGSASDDGRYVSIENQIETLTARRDLLATQMRALLHGAAFNGQAINDKQAQRLIKQATNLINQMHALATSSKK